MFILITVKITQNKNIMKIFIIINLTEHSRNSSIRNEVHSTVNELDIQKENIKF